MELIIAIAILAVVVSPLVANFIQSSKMNLKGRKSLNAMNLAQDMMEGMSGYTAEEVHELIEEVKDDATGTKTLVGTILPQSATHGSVTRTSADGDEVLKYEFADVVTVAGARNEYDVKLVLNPTGDEHEEFNDKEFANISEINQYYDAIYNYDVSELASVIGELYLASNHTAQQDAFYGNIKRTFRIDIVNEGDETAPKYKVSVTRDYEVTDTLAASTGLTGVVKSVTTENISRMDESQMPRSVYLYYQGIENASYNDTPRLDNIAIKNTTGEEITVYLIRTQQENVSTNASYGLTYGCDVTIQSEDMSGTRTEDVHIVSNLRYDLNATKMRYNFRTKDEDGNVFAEEDIIYPRDDAGAEVKTSAYMAERARYYYNGTLVNETLYQSNFSDGYAKEKKDTLYKVSIEIYEKGTTNKVATYDGGLSN